MRKESSAEPIASPSCRVVACPFDELRVPSLTRDGDLAGGAPRSAQAPTLHKAGGSAWSLWLWVAAGFLFMGVLWTGMIIAVRQVDSRTVPLATQEAKP